MNYLSHYVYNHDICGQPQRPVFALGVALPDLWPRFSRRRRLRWRAVRAAVTADGDAAELRAGLLNHVAVDQRFHGLASFLTWQRALKATPGAGDVHSMTLDFMTHVALELALDQRLLRAEPALADRFYDTLAGADPLRVVADVSRVGDVDACGLEDTISLFVARRFLRRYATDEGLAHAFGLALSVIPATALPAEGLAREILRRAATLADPDVIWREMSR